AMPAMNAADRLRALLGSVIAVGRVGGRIIAQRIPPRRLQIVELARADGPEESPAGDHDQHQAQGNQHQQNAHATVSRNRADGTTGARERCGGPGSSRVAFSTTATELIDMPSAASQGGMNPSAASGIEPKL